jgi:hypothetical protein
MIHLVPASHIVKLPESFHKKLVHDCGRLFEVYPGYVQFTIIIPYTDGSSMVLKCTREGKTIKAEVWDNPKDDSVMT